MSLLPALARSGVVLAALFVVACGQSGVPRGLAAPAFSLPGTDGKTHSLSEYAGSRVLALVFTCNSCPDAQVYESRLKTLHTDFSARGLALVAINPNRAASMTLADLAHTDVGESLEDMKVRAAHRKLPYPYLSDADTQQLTSALRVTTLPHIFVFDQARTLQYEGRIDDNIREDQATTHEARQAIDALLSGRPVERSSAPVAGCAVKTGAPAKDEQLAAFESAPVTVEPIDVDGLKKLRQNGTGQLLMVNFWATWCAPCVAEFPELETTYRMFKPRGLEFVTVSENDPGERPAVIEFLKEHRASHPNWLFARPDVYGLQAAFDPQMPGSVPFTVLLAPNGDVLHQADGAADIPKLRRAILANLKDDERSKGMQAYWQEIAK